MSLTRKQEIALYRLCINEGVNIEYGKLSLCDLRNFRYSHVRTNRRYQVHCEDYQYGFSGIYDNLESAIMKFIDLKGKVRGIR